MQSFEKWFSVVSIDKLKTDHPFASLKGNLTDSLKFKLSYDSDK